MNAKMQLSLRVKSILNAKPFRVLLAIASLSSLLILTLSARNFYAIKVHSSGLLVVNGRVDLDVMNRTPNSPEAFFSSMPAEYADSASPDDIIEQHLRKYLFYKYYEGGFTVRFPWPVTYASCILMLVWSVMPLKKRLNGQCVCGYSLDGLARKCSVCPECGTAIDPKL